MFARSNQSAFTLPLHQLVNNHDCKLSMLFLLSNNKFPVDKYSRLTDAVNSKIPKTVEQRKIDGTKCFVTVCLDLCGNGVSGCCVKGLDEATLEFELCQQLRCFLGH